MVLYFSGAIFLIIWVAFMMRQHYALTLQNRIIIDEVKFRYFRLTGKSIDEILMILVILSCLH